MFTPLPLIEADTPEPVKLRNIGLLVTKIPSSLISKGIDVADKAFEDV